MDNKNRPARRLLAKTGLILLIAALTLYVPEAHTQGTGYSLRFYGHGTGDIDRVKIKIDAPSVPVDVGGDFTLEFWMKASSGNNGTATCGTNDGWIYGNIMFDRDVYGAGDYGDYGIALSNGSIAFGASRGNSGNTICGSINVADGLWHHIAVTRRTSDGQMRIYIDGQQNAQGTGPSGDISYRNNRTTGYPNSDPYLVIGAEKHDAGSAFPSYHGWIDEVRISKIIRYSSNFAIPSAPFVTDGNTVALYHFDEGPAGLCGSNAVIVDSSGSSSGTCKSGGSGTPGPVYTTDMPFTGGANTPTRTPTRTNTRTPTALATATLANTPTRTATATSPPTSTYGDDFNRADAPNLGPNWTARTGSFHISSQTAPNASTEDDIIVSYNAGPYSSVAVSAQMQITGGSGTTSIGVRWGSYASGVPTAGYNAELTSSGRVVLWRINNWAQLGSYQIVGYTTGQWITLTLRANGSSLSVDVNGMTRITATDGTFTSGATGLWSYRPTSMNQHGFDNFVIQP